MKSLSHVFSAGFTSYGPRHLGRCSQLSLRWLTGLFLLLLVLSFALSPVYAARSGANPRATFSLDFVNSDIVDVLKALSAQSGVNIVVANGVKAQTTLSLRNVTLEEAMRLVTASNGLDFSWVDVAYVVGSPEQIRGLRVKDLSSRVVTLHQVTAEYAQDVLGKLCPEVSVSSEKGSPTMLLIGSEAALARAERALAQIDTPQAPTTRMVTLSYCKADRVADLLKQAVPGCTVQMGTQQNSLLLTAAGSDMSQAADFVKAVDIMPTTGQATTVIYDVRYANVEELITTLSKRFPDGLKVLAGPRSATPVVQQAKSQGEGVTLAALQTIGGGAGGASTTAGATVQVTHVERLVLMGAEYTIQNALDLLKQIDVPSKQVRIKAMISRINTDKLKSLGIDWFAREGSLTDGILSPVELTEGPIDPNGSSDTLQYRAKKGLGKLFRTQLDFVGTVRALKSTGNAEILAEPSVLTLDGRQVSFHSGEKIFYQTLIGYGTTGQALIDIREVDVGVTLLVTPQINPDGQITLTLQPTVSSASFRTELGTSLPIIDERTAIASVRVKAGEKVVIAGLKEDTKTTDVHSVPFLGDLPVIGKLFRSTKKQHIVGDLVIVVTPEIVEE
jgi:general secretion pathway protein D